MREGTGNFQNGDLLYMATHPVADAIRIGRTKPYDCSYPVMESKPRIAERSNLLGCGNPPSRNPTLTATVGMRILMYG